MEDLIIAVVSVIYISVLIHSYIEPTKVLVDKIIEDIEQSNLRGY